MTTQEHATSQNESRQRGEVSGKIPISLIIDDGAPVDPVFYEHPGDAISLLIPPEFTRRVAETFERFDIHGKFTVIPMPSCLGRIDQSLKRVPPEHQKEWLEIVRGRIAPRFDITPEFLTHLNAYDLKTDRFRHFYEDVWISGALEEEIVEYFTLAFQILTNVGLPATGITSPWEAGIDVEEKYARALAEAHWKVFESELTWYFLHATSWDAAMQCSIEYQSSERRQVVVSVPANAADIFWSMWLPTQKEQRAYIEQGVDRLVSPDGRTGRIRELMESGHPVVLVTHWQSLFNRGTALGLEGFTLLAERIQKVFGGKLEWVTCSEQARRHVDSVQANAH